MFLKTLTIKGFKSFADPTTLVFEPGVTVIVGPNGSGKSNVVDAVAWALGAQAPTSVRSAKMDDVIFAGTASRPGLGRAEVSLGIDNTAGLLPIEFGEVTITRTLFRSGESTYAINGVPCRLLDIQELLSDTGVGRQQHVIVSQRQIEGVLSSRPEDRRAVIEEAAGVLKFRRRKEKSQRRLAATETNLTRLSDMVREIRRQLRPLEVQAEAARRHGDLVVELNGLRRFLSGQEIKQLRHRVGSLDQERAANRHEMQRLSVEVESLDRDVAAAEARLSAAGGQDISDALSRFEGLHERLRGLEALMSERRLRLQRDRNAGVNEDVVATLEAESDRLAGELNDLEAEQAALAPDAAAVTEAEQRLEQLRSSFDERWGDRASPEPSSEAPRLRGEIRALEASIGRDQAELDRLGESLEGLGSRHRALGEELDRNWAEAKEAEVAQQSQQDELEVAERLVEQARLASEQARSALADAVGNRQAWGARREVLALALDETRDQSGIQRLAGIEGVVGTLMEIVDIDRGWEAAFEAAAGEAVAAVVATSTEVAMQAVAILEAGKVSGAVLPLDNRGVVPPAPAAGVPLRPHVRSSLAGMDQLLDILIGSVGVVDTSEEAAAAAAADVSAVVVTRAGDRFCSSGWRVGVRRSGATRELLEEAERAWTRADGEAGAAEQGLVMADDRLEQARQDMLRVRQAVRIRAEAVEETRSRASAVERDLRDAEVEMAALGPRRSELIDKVAEERRRVDELHRELPRHQRQDAEHLERVASMNRARDELARQSQAVNNLRTDLQVRVAGFRERHRLLTAQRRELEHRLSRMATARAEVASRREAIDQRLAVMEGLSGWVAGRVPKVGEQLEELRRRRARESEEAAEAAEQLEELRRRRADAEAGLDRCREQDRSAEIESAETGIRLEAAIERCRRELNCEPGEAVAAVCPPPGTGCCPRGSDPNLGAGTEHHGAGESAGTGGIRGAARALPVHPGPD